MTDDTIKDHVERQAELIGAIAEHHDEKTKHRHRPSRTDDIWKGGQSPFSPGGRTEKSGGGVAERLSWVKDDDGGGEEDLEQAAEMLFENTEMLQAIAESLDLDVSGKALTNPVDEKIWGDSSPFAPDGGR